MIAVIVFIIILGVLIFVHELGHFVTARKSGIKADEFGFGFPPRIFGLQFLYDKKENGETVPAKKKWRIIWGSEDGDGIQERKDLNEAHEKRFFGGTIYSLNWIPLGGFVKIKGEDGSSKKDPDSFSSKPAWIRTIVLAAGVVMNFVLAWVLISAVFMIGAPEPVDSSQNIYPNSKIQISGIIPGSPAEKAGIRIGDEILKTQKNKQGQEIKLASVKDVQDYISAEKGTQINLEVKRGLEKIDTKVTPREDAPEGQGPLGVSLTETVVNKYPWYQAIWNGLKTTINLIVAIFVALFGIIKNLFMGQGVGSDVAGPVGIAVLTKEVTVMGLVYILQFAALLSINLGIINILPFPALDGGRIFFILIEKIKGSPVSQKVEQVFHTLGFVLLIIFLIFVTFKDVMKFVK